MNSQEKQEECNHFFITKTSGSMHTTQCAFCGLEK